MRLTAEPTGDLDLIIPQVGYDANQVPGTRAFDDDFEVFQGWTTMQGSGVTARDSMLLMPSATSITRPGLPKIPFTVTAYCADVNFDNLHTTAGNASLGLGVANPATGYMFALELDVAAVDYTSLFAADWTSLVFGANLGTEYRASGFSMARPHFQRLTVNSTTSVDGFFSWDGRVWHQTLTGHNPGVTLGSVVLLSYACKTAWDWVRFT